MTHRFIRPPEFPFPLAPLFFTDAHADLPLQSFLPSTNPTICISLSPPKEKYGPNNPHLWALLLL